MYSTYLVDDEAIVITGLLTNISWPENGFEVIGTNTSPVAALSEIEAMRPDLVFCDLKMPEMDGIHFVQEIIDRNIGCEFVMLSAYAEFEAARKFFKMDGFDYLIKPLSQQDAAIVLEGISRKLSAKNNITPTIAIAPSGSKVFDELVSYVTANFTKNHSLNSLAEQFHITTSYICNLFTKHYGSTLTIFLTNVRMREAARMMTETDAALKEIAIDCGYSDYFYFCRVFKTHFGIPPTEYRNNAIGSEAP